METLTTSSLEEHVDILSRLSAECQYYLGIGNRAELFVRDSLFHLELVKCTGNKALYTLYERLDSRVQLLRIAQNRSDKELAEIINQHGLIVQHLRNGEKQLCLDLIASHISHQS